MYSNPPLHGARVVDTILRDEKLTAIWHKELIMMSNRIREARHMLVEKLYEQGSSHDWSHINNQIGMFAYTGLSSEQVNILKH